MAPKDKARINPDQEQLKETKRHRKVGFAPDLGLEPSKCIVIHLVNLAQEMEKDSESNDKVPTFPPDFVERFFGEDGKIYGYRDLKVDVWLHALSFHAYIDIQYSEKVQDAGHGKQVTDVHHVFKEMFGVGLVEDRDTFVQSLPTNNSLMGEVLHQYGEVVASWKNTHFEEILRLDLRDTRIKEWHARLSPLVLMFIEAGRPIDQDDPRWEVYVTLERITSENDELWRVLGFCTVYQFYNYPDSTRLRVSQILVFPPYQGNGNGFRLLEAVNAAAVQRDCYDVTMEEPSESLQELRDCMDVVRLLSFQPIRHMIQSTMTRLKSSRDPELNDGPCGKISMSQTNTNGSESSLGRIKGRNWLQPSADLVEVVRKNLKINKMQLQRCWEVLLFLHLNGCDAHIREIFFRLLEWRLKVELFGKSSGTGDSHKKQVVDTDNDYDNSKTFVMSKVRDRVEANGNCTKDLTKELEQQLQETIEEDGNNDRESEVHELLEEREGELERVAEKVVLCCKSLDISLVSASAADNVETD